MRRAAPIDPAWDAFAAELGRNLQRRRMDLGHSQERIAYTAGLSRFTYQKYEQGQSRPGAPANPSLRVLLAISQALETPLHALLPDSVPDLKAH